MLGNYPFITICGGTCFKGQFLDAQKRLTLTGNIVICVGQFCHSEDKVWTDSRDMTKGRKRSLPYRPLYG